jgi:hypothetical protein
MADPYVVERITDTGDGWVEATTEIIDPGDDPDTGDDH